MNKILSNRCHHFLDLFVVFSALNLSVLGTSDISRQIKNCLNGGTIMLDSCTCAHGYTGTSCEISLFEDSIQNVEVLSKTIKIQTKSHVYIDSSDAFETWKATGDRMKREASFEGSGSGFTASTLDSTTSSSSKDVLGFTTESNLDVTTSNVPDFSTSTPDFTTKSTLDFATESTSDFTTEGSSDFITNIIPDLTTEGISDSTTEHTSDVTSEPIPGSTTEDTSDITSEPISDSTTEHTSDVTSKPIPGSTTEDTSDITSEPIPDSTTEDTSDITSEVIPDSTAEDIPNSTTEDASDITLETIPDSTTEGIPDTTGEGISNFTTTSILEYMPTSAVDDTKLPTFAPSCLDDKIYSKRTKICTYAATFLFRFAINNESFRPEYSNPQLPITRDFINKITLEIELALDGAPFISTAVRSIRKGSVIIDADIYFDETANLSTKDVENLLLEKLANQTTVFSNLAVEDKNECIADNICGSNATCTNLVGSFSCVCSPGFVEKTSSNLSRRKQCESPCKSIDCTNGGVCITSVRSKAFCSCPVAYHGDRCQYSAQHWRTTTIVVSVVLIAVILFIVVILAVRFCRTRSIRSRSPDIPLVTGFKSTSDDDLKTYSNPYQVDDVEIVGEHSLKQGSHSDNGRLTNITTFKPNEIEDDRL